MSLKDGKKGSGNEREDSGREWRETRGVGKGMVEVRAGAGRLREGKGGGEGCTAGGSLFLCLIRL